ncbi:hypothetical protein TNCV_2153491 [Trichonephila clavipes]|nr:hypothetical protein TNCV_2153491 [Trichonephila clavipes]
MVIELSSWSIKPKIQFQIPLKGAGAHITQIQIPNFGKLADVKRAAQMLSSSLDHISQLRDQSKGFGRTGSCLEEPMVLETMSGGTKCNTILYPMRNGKDLEECERALFERLRKTKWSE